MVGVEPQSGGSIKLRQQRVCNAGVTRTRLHLALPM
jgi:hypothetical protein